MSPIEYRNRIRREFAVVGVVLGVLFAGSALHANAPTVLKPNFNGYLAEGYRQLAVVAVRAAADHHVVDYYKTRNAQAVQGRLLSPQTPDPRGLDPENLHEANYAREKLVARLEGGARRYQPLLAAITQVNFDCWVVPLPRRPGVPDSNECRRRFYFAFAGLAAKSPQPTSPAV